MNLPAAKVESRSLSATKMIGFDTKAQPEHSALEEGYIAEGGASAPTGIHGWDNPGTGYGGGERFEYEETPGMTKVVNMSRRNK